MWLAHIWLDSECLQSYQAITKSSWWDQSVCAVYKFSGRNFCQVMNNTILSSKALQQQNTTLVRITCELFSIHSRNLLWWLSKIWTKRNNLLLFRGALSYQVNVASWLWDRPLNTKWDLLRFLILPYSKMIYNKNILHLNNGGISSDSRKFWMANVRWLTVICSPEIQSANKKVLFHWCDYRRGQTEQS